MSDTSPNPQILTIPLTFPTLHSSILTLFRSSLQSIPRTRDSKVIAVIDSIVSNPGWVLPWEEMVKVCKEENVISIIDGAHSIGQQKIDLEASEPDYFVTVCFSLQPAPMDSKHSTKLPELSQMVNV